MPQQRDINASTSLFVITGGELLNTFSEMKYKEDICFKLCFIFCLFFN